MGKTNFAYFGAEIFFVDKTEFQIFFLAIVLWSKGKNKNINF